jgi:hypothetical protein
MVLTVAQDMFVRFTKATTESCHTALNEFILDLITLGLYQDAASYVEWGLLIRPHKITGKAYDQFVRVGLNLYALACAHAPAHVVVEEIKPYACRIYDSEPFVGNRWAYKQMLRNEVAHIMRCHQEVHRKKFADLAFFCTLLASADVMPGDLPLADDDLYVEEEGSLLPTNIPMRNDVIAIAKSATLPFLVRYHQVQFIFERVMPTLPLIDDDLFPALYSHESGGKPLPLSDARPACADYAASGSKRHSEVLDMMPSMESDDDLCMAWTEDHEGFVKHADTRPCTPLLLRIEEEDRLSEACCVLFPPLPGSSTEHDTHADHRDDAGCAEMEL